MMDFLKVLNYFENIEVQEYLETKRSTTSIKMQGDLYPREVFVLVLTDSSVKNFGDHTGESNENLKSHLTYFERYMTFPQADQPHLEVGLNNQRSILHQLCNLVITTTDTKEELERSWQTLVQEEEREILCRQRRAERQDRRNKRQARRAQAQSQN